MRIAIRPNAIRSLSRGSHPFRPYVTTTSISEDLSILLKNPELTPREAKNELRWIKQAVSESSPGKAADQAAKARKGTVSDNDAPQVDSRLRELVVRRGNGEPLQYILGTTDFGPLTLLTRQPVLIPRPETAYITTHLVDKLKPSLSTSTSKPFRILDLCCGSGCISLLLAHHLQQIAITGMDISSEAIALSRDNATRTGLEINLMSGDLFDDTFCDTLGQFDLIVSNPPYIPKSEWEGLSPSVKAYEDPRALIGDPEEVGHALLRDPIGSDDDLRSDGKGLGFYRRISTLAPTLLDQTGDHTSAGLRSVPRLAVEIGLGQADHVETTMKNLSRGAIQRTEIWKDQYGVERMVVGY